ncbi:hypothetical protein V6N13_100430 [Hibiscus sabdariffa]
MVTVTGEWDWNWVRDILLVVVLERLAATSPLLAHIGNDVSGWCWDEKKEFQLSFAYSYLMDTVIRSKNTQWRRIWALKIPQQVRVFMWLAGHQAHLTNAERVRCHLATLDVCSLCNGGSENMDHVLRSFFGRSHVGVPPAAVADLVAEEQRHWGERLIVDTESNSHCRRVDPRG